MSNPISSLSAPKKMAMHLAAGASDGMLTSAIYVFDETGKQSVQEALDKIRENSSTGGITDILVNGESVVSNNIANITLPTSLQLEANTDLNNLVEEGYYYCTDDIADTILNTPEKASNSSFGIRVQFVGGERRTQQVLFTANEDVFVRSMSSNNSFGSWVKLVKDSDLTDYVLATELSQVAFSGSFNDITDFPGFDNFLDLSSENAVQNKIVTEELNKKLEEDDFRPITSEELNTILT